MPKSKTRKQQRRVSTGRRSARPKHSKLGPTMVLNGNTHVLKKHKTYSLRSNPKVVAMNSREEFAVLFALTSANVLAEVNTQTLETLSASSGVASASIALEELAREGVLPLDNAKSWLENQYLGTWVSPEDSVQVFVGDFDLVSRADPQEMKIYRDRLSHFANNFEQKLTSGKTAVWLETGIDDFSKMLMCQFIYRGSMPDVYVPN